LRALVEKTKAVEVANCYIKKFLHDFPETKTLSNEAKLTEINAICEIVPESKDMLAIIIQNTISEHSLGFSIKSPEQRRDALQDLAGSSSRLAQNILAEANIGELARNPFDPIRKHFGYFSAWDKFEEERSNEDYENYKIIRQKRIANVFHLAFTGSKRAQELITETSGTSPSLLQFYLTLNSSLGIKKFGERQAEMNNETHALLRHVFRMINILTEPHSFGGGTVDFLRDVEAFVLSIEDK
jgi:hypothetical protein